MSKLFNIDVVVELVKNIVDYNRCAICDKLDGPRMRYSCGHTGCEDCVTKPDCLLCLTPPSTSTFNEPVPDDPLTKRVTNASKLLSACQDAFNVDVYERHRVSEQQKIEKDLFPKCIQALAKYSNKRKSSKVSLENKENRASFFPGEQISPLKNSKMENSNYVQHWLDQNVKNGLGNNERRPFTDLKVNNNTTDRKFCTPKRRVDLIMENVHNNSENVTKREINRKRTHFKSTLSNVKSQSLLDKYLKPVETKKQLYCTPKKRKLESDKKNDAAVQNVLNITDKDESGIVIDEEPIVIDDSQSEIIDKDKLAWLAVLEAYENETLESTPSVRQSEIVNFRDVEKSLSKPNEFTKKVKSGYNKVPFYKKGYLSETCTLCEKKDIKNQSINNKDNGKNKDVSITIESDGFITVVKMSDTTQNNSKLLKLSVPVQTDIKGIEQDGKNFIEKSDKIEEKHSKKFVIGESDQIPIIKILSQDLFTVEAKDITDNKSCQVFKNESKRELQKQNNEFKEAKNVVIPDSDSDDDLNASCIIQVKADVHRSSDEFDYSVLTEIDKSEVLQRPKRAVRGPTPTSTDSSDKENFDPNRAKRSRHGKKDVGKKNRKKRDFCHSIRLK